MLISGVTLPSSPQPRRDFVGDELAVGEDLEVAVRDAPRTCRAAAGAGTARRRGCRSSCCRAASHRRSMRFMSSSEMRFDRRCDVDPAALAAQLAAGDHRDEEERREIFAALQPALVLLDRQHALDAEVPGELPEQPRVGSVQHAFGEARASIMRLTPLRGVPQRCLRARRGLLRPWR